MFQESYLAYDIENNKVYIERDYNKGIINNMKFIIDYSKNRIKTYNNN